ncbi:HCLS1-associated protein X-1-like [Aricia agestis]|uniref:HCLS1-associated protein X-1-like n=1 Tax=Aricia agestis TaxID=91739 RepID=UPI001C2065E2|nr:HCLS1-associated protein X-1-like [Aricia agestis]
MSQDSFMNKIRSFLGIPTEPPRNDFRNPIWGSDDDDDDVDELYTRDRMENFSDPLQMHRELFQQMHEMFSNFGTLFGEMGSFFNDENFRSLGTMTVVPEIEEHPEHFDSNRIRDYYLKPGFQKPKLGQPKEDVDLDGKISSNDISDMLQLKDRQPNSPSSFYGEVLPGRSVRRTIITTSITKPDGTIETRRIVKDGNEVLEETITSTDPSRGPYNPSTGPIDASHIFSQLSSFFRNFH